MGMEPTLKKQKVGGGSDGVEAAEMNRLREAHAQSTKLQFHDNGTPVGDHPRAAGIFKCFLGSSDFKALQQLYTVSKATINKMVPWGNGSSDARRRGYAFLPNGSFARLGKAGIRISCEGAYDDSEESVNLAEAVHRKTIRQACGVILQKQVTQEMTSALAQLAMLANDCVQAEYKGFCTLDELVALQPNLHREALFLPLHLDAPRHDGFGMIIVTIAMTGSAEIVLVDDGDDDEEPMSWSFPLCQGEFYMLSGNARNKCMHGVIAGEQMRESFNLRFGLHTEEMAHDEVGRHWPD
jgi:hypothetical protein